MKQYEELDKIGQYEVMQSSLNFTRALTNAYGMNTGHEIWQTINKQLGVGLETAIFEKILMGESCNATADIKLKGNTNITQKIPLIKVIRKFTIGESTLRIAKNAADNIDMGRDTLVQISGKDTREFLTAILGLEDDVEFY